jgi:hypothetical protein
MNSLNELIGKRVIALIADFEIECEVLQVTIDDYYFEEKKEPIYIKVSLMPTILTENELDSFELSKEDFYEVSLDNILKA